MAEQINEIIGLTLRELTPLDALAYFEAWDYSRQHIARYQKEVLDKYLSVESVAESILTPDPNDRLRYGIWAGEETFVGSINITRPGPPPETNIEASVGYWIDRRHLRQGFAKQALRSLTRRSASRYGGPFETIGADVHKRNLASRRVLERIGYRLDLSNAASEEHLHYKFGG